MNEDTEAEALPSVLTHQVVGAPWDLEHEPARSAYRPSADPPAPGVVYAELPLRGAALAIDIILANLIERMILAPLISVIIQLLQMDDSVGQLTPPSQIIKFLLEAGVPTVIVIALTGLVAVYFWTVFRATPGQMALGLFTLRASDGLAMTRRGATVRWLVIIVPSMVLTTASTLVFAISSILDITPIDVSAVVVNLLALTVPLGWYGVLAYTIVQDPRGQGIHDRVAGSVVVRREGSPS